MDELAAKIASARRGLTRAEDHYDDAWLDRQAHAFGKRYARRLRARRIGGSGACALFALISAAAIHRYSAAPSAPSAEHLQARPAVPEPIHVEDGSTVTAFDGQTVFELKESSAERAVVALVSGGARFQVAHRPMRAFFVEAGLAVVEVLGTEFTVERIAERVRVSVLSGQVQVTSNGHTSQLVEGEIGVFPRPLPTDSSDPASPSGRSGDDRLLLDDPRGYAAESGARGVLADAHGKTSSNPKWRTLAARGNLGGAYQELERDGWAIDRDPASLLLAADVARRTQHPAQAVAPLRRMLQTYPRDPRASAAAFTLGRVLMETGAYREAASSFALAASLDTAGAITEDAAAREVEAWSGAGDVSRARERAREYARRYPGGRRLDAVRRYGGLE
jgi:transmembrane sensor